MPTSTASGHSVLLSLSDCFLGKLTSSSFSLLPTEGKCGKEREWEREMERWLLLLSLLLLSLHADLKTL